MSVNIYGTPNEHEMAAIRAVGCSEKVSADELFVFDVDLCDDRVDRDGERFDAETLREFAPMFVGKSGIFDHEWSAKGQTARLFECEAVEVEDGAGGSGGYASDSSADGCAGDGLAAVGCRTVLRGRAYMLRAGNERLIREIEAGIKREVSVGVAVRERRCSICGGVGGGCGHVAGREYGGKKCVRVLHGAADVYEWSFVAVPAQKDAGIVARERMTAYRMGRRSDKNNQYKIGGR